jgi:hypothetical protein
MNTNSLKQVCLSVSKMFRAWSHARKLENGAAGDVTSVSMPEESSRTATYVNERIVRSATVRVRIACICGAGLYELSLTSRVTCPHCHRTYGVRALAYTAGPHAVEPLHVSIGYIVDKDTFAEMRPVGRPA